MSPRGAAARESAFIQSYRAELAHFVSVIAGESEYEAPSDQIALHRIVEAIYKSADEGREIKLCCDGCKTRALRNAETTLATVAKLRADNGPKR